jgi:hypothetical protein
MGHQYHTIKRRKQRNYARTRTLKRRGGKKKINLAKQAGKMGTKTAKVLKGVSKNAKKQLRATKSKLIDMGSGASKKGKRFLNKVRRSVTGQVLVISEKMIPNFTKKQVDNLEKKLSTKVAETGTEGLSAGSNIIKNIRTNPKLKRQAKKLAKTSFRAVKDGAVVVFEKGGKLYKPATKAVIAAFEAGVKLGAAPIMLGIGVVKEAAFAVPGVADGYNLVTTGIQLGDQMIKGTTKVMKLGVEAGKLGNVAFEEAMDLPEDVVAGVRKVKNITKSIKNLAEDAVGRGKRGGRKTRKQRRRRRHRRTRKRKRKRKNNKSRRFRRHRKHRKHKTRRR